MDQAPEMSTAPDYGSLVERLFTLKRLPDAVGETTLTPEEASDIRSLGFHAKAGPWKVPALPPELTRDTIFETLSIGWRGEYRPWWRWMTDTHGRSIPPNGTGTRHETPRVSQAPAGSSGTEPRNVRGSSQPVPAVSSNRERATPIGLNREAAAQEMSALAVDACREQPRINAPMPPSRQSLEADQKLVKECASKIVAAAQAAGGEIDRRRVQQKLWRYKAKIFHQALTYLAKRGRVNYG
jgi:hypothetical protein